MSQSQDNTKDLYFRLLRYVWPYRWVFLVSVLAMIVGAATDSSLAALMKWLIDGTFVEKDPVVMKWLPLTIVAITLIRVLASFAGSYAIGWVGSRVVMDLRKLMFNRLMELPLGYFSDNASGRIVSKFTYDVSQVNSAATGVITVAIKDSLTIIGLLAWLFYLNWKLTLLALTVAPLLAWLVRKFSIRMRQVSRGTQRAMGGVSQVLNESIDGHRVVKVFGGQAYEGARFANAINQFRALTMKQVAATASNSAMGELVAAFMLALIVFLVTQQAVTNEATVGGFVSFITAAMMLLAPLKRLTNINEPLQRGLAAAESVFELLDEPAEIDDGKTALGRAKGKIEFDQVTFRYPDGETNALKSISFQVSPGEFIAFVGASGSGKTTLANMIPRFFQPTAGRVLVDEIELTQLTLSSLRNNIASVSQDVVLFNDTVAANIAYGPLASATREEIKAAADAAYATEFILAMPNGFDTLIGENGVKLSGGQRQRLAIARALLKNAPILILDEATSALDTESERQVQYALDNLMKSRTTIVIAHRLSTVEKADRIVVMESGQIVETGSHAQLIRTDGPYAKLHRGQLVS